MKKKHLYIEVIKCVMTKGNGREIHLLEPMEAERSELHTWSERSCCVTTATHSDATFTTSSSVTIDNLLMLLMLHYFIFTASFGVTVITCSDFTFATLSDVIVANSPNVIIVVVVGVSDTTFSN